MKANFSSAVERLAAKALYVLEVTKAKRDWGEAGAAAAAGIAGTSAGAAGAGESMADGDSMFASPEVGASQGCSEVPWSLSRHHVGIT